MSIFDDLKLLESKLRDALQQLANLRETHPPTIQLIPMPTDPDALLPWTTPENCRHNARAIADLEGLTEQQKDDFSKTFHCESGWDNTIVMYNCERGFVRSTAYDAAIHGAILSKDIGFFQINSYWHVGPGKDFPSEDYVLQNPTEVGHWSAKQFKANPRIWVCYSKGMYAHYSA